jgi:hypothetical protein
MPRLVENKDYMPHIPIYRYNNMFVKNKKTKKICGPINSTNIEKFCHRHGIKDSSSFRRMLTGHKKTGGGFVLAGAKPL